LNPGAIVGQIDLALRIEAEIVVAAAASRGFEAALDWSSGPFSQADLDRKDNPYARRHGSPLLDPGRINVQTGQFRSGWEVRGDRLHRQIVNDSNVADFLKGTPSMFSRPIWDRIEAAVLEAVPGAEYEPGVTAFLGA
jgi:hypothetical protein